MIRFLAKMARLIFLFWMSCFAVLILTMIAANMAMSNH
jgi:hypothetical protein